MAAIEGSARYRDLLPALRDTVAQLPDVIRELRLLVRGLGRAAQPGGDLVAVLRELSRLLAAGADRLEAGRRA